MVTLPAPTGPGSARPGFLVTGSPTPGLSRLLAEIATEAASTEPLPDLTFSAYRQFADVGHRLAYERRYFRRRARLVALAAAAQLDPDLPVDGLSDLLWSVCDEYTWALPAHVAEAGDGGWGPEQCADLFACETAHTVAETVAALGDRLDPRVAARVRAEVQRRVFAPFADARPLSWEGSGNNWEAVCAGAAGMAALALLPDGAQLTALLRRCGRAMDRFLAGYGDDGGCPEGIGYWAYGFGYFVYFAEALRARTGEDLLASAKVGRIAAFPQRISLGGGTYVPFSDTSAEPVLPAGLLGKLAERFGIAVPAVDEPSLHDDHCYRWGHLSRTLAWWRPAGRPVTEQSSYLPDLGWVVDRADGFAFAAKGGHNDEPHNHNDLGHFVLRVDGRNLLDDLGAGEYTRDYFGAGRYLALHPSAEGHSIPLLDGRPQLAGAERRAVVLSHQVTEDGVRFDLDLTAAYDVAGLRSFVRSFSWSRSGRLDLIDEIVADRDLSLDELFISRERPLPHTGGAGWAGVIQLEQSGFDLSIETIETADHHGRPDVVHRLRLRGVAPAGTSRHHFVFTLQRAG